MLVMYAVNCVSWQVFDTMTLCYVVMFGENLLSLVVLLILQAILEIVINLQFNMIEEFWQVFWRKPTR